METFKHDILASCRKIPWKPGVPLALLRHLLAVTLLKPQPCSEWTRHYWETIRSTGLFDNMTPSLLLSCLAVDGLAIWDILGADITDKKQGTALRSH